jgi:hypothetical protein
MGNEVPQILCDQCRILACHLNAHVGYINGVALVVPPFTIF